MKLFILHKDVVDRAFNDVIIIVEINQIYVEIVIFQEFRVIFIRKELENKTKLRTNLNVDCSKMLLLN